MKLIGTAHPGFCLAIDSNNSRGVWWWHPGRSGCASRSTGPTVIDAEDATVASTASGAVEVRFQLQLMVGGPRQVRLILQDGVLRDLDSGEHVSTVSRRDRNIPPDFAP
jgi:hypothetical protein